MKLKKTKKAGRRDFARKIKETAKKKQFRLGTYTVATTIVILAILVVINMCAGAIPTKYTQLDMTSTGMYSIGDETKSVVSNIEDDVTVYWIVQDGEEDETVENLLEQNKDLNKKLTVEKVDPVINPNFASRYTNDSVYNNSLVVVCEAKNKSRYVSYYDIYSTSYDEDYNTVTEYNGEGALTAALNYVTSDGQTKVYTLSGHGEQTIPDNFQSAMENQNIALETLSLLSEGSVPEDCESLLIYSPASDLSKAEVKAIRNYVKKGGSVMMFTDCQAEELPNLYGMMEKYGVKAVSGMIVEKDANYYASGYPNYLIPEIEEHDITQPLTGGNYYVLMPIAQGLEISQSQSDSEDGDSYMVTPLLTTTDQAFSKKDGINATSAEKESGDISTEDGFAVGVAVTDDSGSAEGKIVWYTSSYITDQQMDTLSAGANMDLIINSISWMCDTEEAITIHAKTMNNEYLTLTSAQSGRWTIILVIVIPLAFLISGIYVWAKRRKK